MFGSFGYDTSNKKTENTPNNIKATPFDQIPPVQLCIERIRNVEIRNNSYVFDVSNVLECRSLKLTSVDVHILSSQNASAAIEVLQRHNITFDQEASLALSIMKIRFNLRTIHYSPLTADQHPECYRLAVSIAFDNQQHTGQVKIDLTTNIAYISLCNGRLLEAPTVSPDTVFMGIVDFIVLVVCLASLMLCCRALVKAHLLKLAATDYFAVVLRRPLTMSDRLDFCNLWYVMIVANDVLIVIGTICKVSIEFQDFDNSLFTTTGILLGVGALLVYVGVLRYFGFFSQYNILVLTLKKSLPNILRFMTCAFVLYAGFLLAGWVIIGPYSMKFRTLSKSSEALFSLLNGDDMFATFFTISENNVTIKVFGTIYIYVFVSLFIYVVLSLFIAIIMDAYEIVKDRYDHGLSIVHSVLHEFINSAEPPLLNEQDDLGTSATDCDCWDLWDRIRRLCSRRQVNGYGSFHQQDHDEDDADARDHQTTASNRNRARTMPDLGSMDPDHHELDQTAIRPAAGGHTTHEQHPIHT